MIWHVTLVLALVCLWVGPSSIADAGHAPDDDQQARQLGGKPGGGLLDILKDGIETGADAVGRMLGLSAPDLVRAIGAAKDEASRHATKIVYETSPITVEDEWAYGSRIAEAVSDQLVISDDDAVYARIRRLAEPILEHVVRTSGKPYTIYIVEEDVVNAFAMMGGHIYIYRGLIDTMGTDAAIQSVIAHEIAHVELEHCVTGSWVGIRVSESTQNDLLTQLSTGAFRLLLQNGYSELQEFESDRYAYEAQADMGIPKKDRLQFVHMLKVFAEQDGLKGDQAEDETVLGTISEELARHYRTHPSGQERIDKLESLDLP